VRPLPFSGQQRSHSMPMVPKAIDTQGNSSRRVAEAGEFMHQDSSTTDSSIAEEFADLDFFANGVVDLTQTSSSADTTDKKHVSWPSEDRLSAVVAEVPMSHKRLPDRRQTYPSTSSSTGRHPSALASTGRVSNKRSKLMREFARASANGKGESFRRQHLRSVSQSMGRGVRGAAASVSTGIRKVLGRAARRGESGDNASTETGTTLGENDNRRTTDSDGLFAEAGAAGSGGSGGNVEGDDSGAGAHSGEAEGNGSEADDGSDNADEDELWRELIALERVSDGVDV